MLEYTVNLTIQNNDCKYHCNNEIYHEMSHNDKVHKSFFKNADSRKSGAGFDEF